MPFLTTPTLSRDLPWMDGCPHILHTSIKPQTTHIHNHAESCIFPSDGFFFLTKTHHNLTCGWDQLPGGKGNRGLGPKNRAMQLDRENN